MIHWSETDGVCIATIDRPEKRNALDLDAADALIARLEDARGTGDAPSPPLVLTGAGTTFSSGFDLSNTGHGLRFKERMDVVLDLITGHPSLTVAALNGPAVGMGLVLAATCDLRVAAPDAWLEIPAARLGFVLGEPYVASVSRRLGPTTARWLFVGSRRLDVTRACAWGAIHEVADDPVAVAKEWGERVVGLSPVSIAAHKAILNRH